MLTLDQVVPGTSVVVEKVGGARSFRRRLMELGIIPGISVQVLRIAPFGDPMELEVRGCNLSIRAAEAREVEVQRGPSEAPRTTASGAWQAASGHRASGQLASGQPAPEGVGAARATDLLERVR